MHKDELVLARVRGITLRLREVVKVDEVVKRQSLYLDDAKRVIETLRIS